MLGERRDVDLQVGPQRKLGQRFVERIMTLDVEDRDVGVATGHAPKVPPLALPLQFLRIVALRRNQRLGLFRPQVGR